MLYIYIRIKYKLRRLLLLPPNTPACGIRVGVPLHACKSQFLSHILSQVCLREETTSYIFYPWPVWEWYFPNEIYLTTSTPLPFPVVTELLSVMVAYLWMYLRRVRRQQKTKGATSGCVREAKQQEAHTMASFAVFRRVNQSRERYCYIMDNGLRANGFKMAERDRCKFCIAPNQLLFWMREYRRIFYGWWSFFPLFLPRSKISSVQNEHIYYAISVTLSKFNSFQLPYLFYLLL